jgi:hypothetical protein
MVHRIVRVLPAPEGPVGPVGPAGPAGPAGSSAAWAVVASNGTLTRDSGVTSVSRSSADSYLVTFDQSVSASAFLATTGSVATPTSPSDTRIGFAEAVLVSGQSTQVRVFTYDKGGSSGNDRAFSIVTFC